MILEEGLEFDVLERVSASIGETSKKAGVPVVTGDTKVMEQGKIERMVIATSAIGRRSSYLNHDLEVASQYRKLASRWMTDDNLGEGDAIIATGTLGDHGIALLSFREGYGFDSAVRSDIAPLNGLAEDILKVGGAVSMKDPTRGGLANAVNEWSTKSKVGIEVVENSIPINDAVRNACEMLGLDPLTIGNEGKMIVGVVREREEEVLRAIRAHPYGRDAAIIGHATKKYHGVVLITEVGGKRILEPPVGDPVPRIC